MEKCFRKELKISTEATACKRSSPQSLPFMLLPGAGGLSSPGPQTRPRHEELPLAREVCRFQTALDPLVVKLLRRLIQDELQARARHFFFPARCATVNDRQHCGNIARCAAMCKLYRNEPGSSNPCLPEASAGLAHPTPFR